MQVQISEQSAKRAKFPHELFLFNLITNHILLFVGLLGLVKSYPILAAVTPTISILVLGYLLLRNQQVQRSEADWFTRCHWQLAARRSRFFIGMLLVLGLILLALFASVDGVTQNLRPGHYALLGVTLLPMMFTILALIVMESDAMHQAKQGKLPQWLFERNPNPTITILAE